MLGYGVRRLFTRSRYRSFQEVQPTDDIGNIVNEIRTDGSKVNIIYFTNILVLGILLLGWIVGLLSCGHLAQR